PTIVPEEKKLNNDSSNFDAERLELRSLLQLRLNWLKAQLDQAPKPAANDKEGAAQIRHLRAAIDQTQKELLRVPDTALRLSFTPANLVRILEDTGHEKIQLYNPRQTPSQALLGMTADKGSKIRIEINPDQLTEQILLGQVGMTASIAGSGRTGGSAK